MVFLSFAMYFLAASGPNEDKFCSIRSVPFIKWERWQSCHILLESAAWSWLPPLWRSIGIGNRNSRSFFFFFLFFFWRKKEKSQHFARTKCWMVTWMVKLPSKQMSQSHSRFGGVWMYVFVSGTYHSHYMTGRRKAKILGDIFI